MVGPSSIRFDCKTGVTPHGFLPISMVAYRRGIVECKLCLVNIFSMDVKYIAMMLLKSCMGDDIIPY
jgi:hypothetical protein